jgi:hypothetical protein
MGTQALRAAELSEEERLQNTARHWQEQHDYRKAHARIREEVQRRSVEGMLRHELTKADAVLHSYTELPQRDGAPAQIVVEWSERGQTYRYRSTIDARMNLVSSGICLSGRDRDFDLASLVSVMTDSDTRWDDY